MVGLLLPPIHENGSDVLGEYVCDFARNESVVYVKQSK